MKAHEARRATEAAKLGLLSIERCISLIEAAAFLGQGLVELPAEPNGEARHWLEKQGYSYSLRTRILSW